VQQTWTRNNATETAGFQYDVLGRLTQDGSNANNQFGYDAVGNRLSETQPSKSFGYESNSNRLSSINGISIQRDAVGNTLADSTRQYQYNGMNRLSGLTNSQNNVQAGYTYNYLGQRVRKQLTGGLSEDTFFVYGLQGELLGEYRADGQVIREYLYQSGNGFAELVAEVDSSGALVYVHTDHLGTPRLATGPSQVVVWRWVSDAFGTNAVDEDPDGDLSLTTIHHRFAGQYFDEESGLYYNWNRYYESQSGRYITSDPIGLNGGVNTFGYVAGNPIAYTDPTGECPWCVAYVIFEVGMAVYDVYDTADTLLDPCASGREKFISGGLFILGAVLPGGGYSKVDDIYDATKSGDEFIDVYRAFGGDARAQGFSWTTKDPRSVSNFRDLAGLPSGGVSGATNTAEFLIQGKANVKDIIKSRSALPLDGNKGGLPELIIDPNNVNLTNFSVIKP